MMKAPIGLKTKISERTSFLSQLWVIGKNHATLTGSDELVGIETKTAQASKTAATPPCTVSGAASSQIFSPVSFCRIFNNGKAIPFGQIRNRVHIHRMSVYVHRHNRARF